MHADNLMAFLKYLSALSLLEVRADYDFGNKSNNKASAVSSPIEIRVKAYIRYNFLKF